MRYYLTFIVAAAFLMTSCAQKTGPAIPQSHLPPKNVPQIGSTKPPTPPPGVQHARPAIIETMIQRAKTQLDRNQPDAAFRTLERALAVDGQDALVWHLMAKTRLAQKQYSQAVSMAKKSSLLAGNQTSLKEKNKKIIARAIENQGNIPKTK